jgi:hypothetical protein
MLAPARIDLQRGGSENSIQLNEAANDRTKKVRRFSTSAPESIFLKTFSWLFSAFSLGPGLQRRQRRQHLLNGCPDRLLLHIFRCWIEEAK